MYERDLFFRVCRKTRSTTGSPVYMPCSCRKSAGAGLPLTLRPLILPVMQSRRSSKQGFGQAIIAFSTPPPAEQRFWYLLLPGSPTKRGNAAHARKQSYERLSTPWPELKSNPDSLRCQKF